MSETKAERQKGSAKMGEMPIHRLFLSMSIPLIISMLVQSLYNIVDSIFVAKINEDALTAVSLVGPVMNLMFAVAAGTGVGFNAIISRRLGQKDQKAANETANNGVFLLLISYLVFLVIGLTCSRRFLLMQTDIPSIVDYGTTYMTIVMCLSIGMFGQVTIEKLLQSTGRTFFTMITQMTGALINILFDWLLIFGIGPFPQMGVAGAALATIFGQCEAMILGLIFNSKYNDEISFSLRMMKPNPRLIKEIYRIGIPSIIMISIGSVMTFAMNKILMGFTSTAVAIFGAYFRLQSIVFMPSFGMNNAMIPIVGYNYGAGNLKRISQVYRIGCCYTMAVMVIGFVLFQVIPGRLLLMFSASENMLSIGIPALRIMSFVFLLAGVSVMTGGLFQGTGRSIYSMVVSCLRQLVVLLPAAFLLARLGNVNYVWLALPIAEVGGFLTTMVFLRRLKRIIRKEFEQA